LQSDIQVKLDSIESAIEAIREGKVIIVVDDEDRENEGDFICAAECITPEIVNFMAMHGRGLICTPIEPSRAKELGLELMVRENTAMHHTAFTVSIDLIGHGCTTGISSYDRATGIKAITDQKINAKDFARPGHIFPLLAKHGGVLRRSGHTEAAVDLARLAGFYPAGVLVEILNDDGTMARLPQLLEVAKKFDLRIISIKDLIAYRMRIERNIIREIETKISTPHGEFNLVAYRQISSGDYHFALFVGEIDAAKDTLVRVHSNTDSAEVYTMLFGPSHETIEKSLDLISKEKNGVFLYMKHGDKSENLIRNLHLLQNGELQLFNEDEKDFGTGAQILRDLGVGKVRLLTNHPKKRVGILGYGLEITDYVHF
jgi:3,4-dihydroxy 2-butanone 4-phosphate synthase / GTP cyclohydrolase II